MSFLLPLTMERSFFLSAATEVAPIHKAINYETMP